MGDLQGLAHRREHVDKFAVEQGPRTSFWGMISSYKTGQCVGHQVCPRQAQGKHQRGKWKWPTDQHIAGVLDSMQQIACGP